MLAAIEDEIVAVRSEVTGADLLERPGNVRWKPANRAQLGHVERAGTRADQNDDEECRCGAHGGDAG